MSRQYGAELSPPTRRRCCSLLTELGGHALQAKFAVFLSCGDKIFKNLKGPSKIRDITPRETGLFRLRSRDVKKVFTYLD
mmetsp:Transcript_6862/g.9218  ORF Transcript_6862/g.9218 Transcript_6862/m.9218 type:complete len:80 (-) Transcript_6862:481-720(-)